MNEPNPEETIFAAARQLPPEDRAAYLDQACGDNELLRQRIEALLNASEQSGAFLEISAAPTLRRTPAASIPLAEKPGDKVGRYKLLQQIGEGGCGVVYMAEQEEPVRRRVALKIIKLGMDTRQVIARFEAERQALAMMDHPNIAKVFDAGATETGRPYFVMELVRGIRITDYCDELRLSIRPRLDLFMQVCHAIQHAHQKGIIHRDIKPSNILVTVNDGVPVPKVIDFGIVKATGGQQLTDKTIFTAFEQFIGTPAYMSPEQAVLTSVDIDTRSDIYALGVLLYELLTSKTPFEASELLAAGLDEMRRTIREQEPARPSTRLSTMPDNESSTTAQRRGLDAPKLVTELRGDLDWIVMKCVEKDRARRYETANGLAMDIQRHLDNEPVVARPPNKFYQFQKMVRRNKLAFAAGTAVAAALLIGLTISTILFFKEKQDRDEAVRQKQRADNEAAAAKATVEFLQKDLLSQASSSSQASSGFTPDPNLTIRKALDRASEHIGERFKDQPLVEAAIQDTIGKAYSDLGEYKLAVPHLERTVELRIARLGQNNALTLASEQNLAWAYDNIGRASNAVPMLEEILKFNKAKLGPEAQDTLWSMSRLATAYNTANRNVEAIKLYEQALKLQKVKLGPTNHDTLATMHNLAEAYQSSDRLAEAIPLYEELLKLDKAANRTNYPRALLTMNNLAAAYLKTNRVTEALQLFEETLKLETAIQGPDHPQTLESILNLAKAYSKAGRLTNTIPLYEEVLKIRMAKLGPDHRDTVLSLNNLAMAYQAAGRSTDADRVFSDVLTPAFASQPQSSGVMQARAMFFASFGRWKEAVADFARVIEFNPDEFNPDDAMEWHRFAALLVQAGELDLYREHCRKSVERFVNTTNPSTAQRIAMDCLILPSSEANLEIVSRLADNALIVGTNAGPSAPITKALAEYRQGRFASAVDWSEKALARPTALQDPKWFPFVQVESDAVLAMGRYQLKQNDLARAALATGQEIADDKLPKLGSNDFASYWNDWIIAQALMREAQALIDGVTETNSVTK